jgi:hypothetical protein
VGSASLALMASAPVPCIRTRKKEEKEENEEENER